MVNRGLSVRDQSWELLRNLARNGVENWIVGGDFNEVMDKNEKYGGRRKARTIMEAFRKVADDLALTDMKLDRGWFTWSNNRKGMGLVKERLDRFLVSTSWLSS